jgi:hypothetical protein
LAIKSKIMKKFYTFFPAILLLTFWNVRAFAQCNPNPCQLPTPEPDAHDACILPNPDALDCYFGATWASTPVTQPPTWCTTVENNHFFAFTADAPTATFTICTYGCGSGAAIQAAVLSTPSCDNLDFTFVSPCLGNIASGTCQDLVANGMVPGQNYYLMIDGNAGAQCDYSINGVNPTINGPTRDHASHPTNLVPIRLIHSPTGRLTRPLPVLSRAVPMA